MELANKTFEELKEELERNSQEREKISEYQYKIEEEIEKRKSQHLKDCKLLQEIDWTIQLNVREFNPYLIATKSDKFETWFEKFIQLTPETDEPIIFDSCRINYVDGRRSIYTSRVTIHPKENYEIKDIIKELSVKVVGIDFTEQKKKLEDKILKIKNLEEEFKGL